MPQLNLVPVRPSSSRITQSSGVSGAALTECLTPFTVRSIAIAFPADRSLKEDPPPQIHGSLPLFIASAGSPGTLMMDAGFGSFRPLPRFLAMSVPPGNLQPQAFSFVDE